MLDLIFQAATTIFHFLTASFFLEPSNPELQPQTMKEILILGGSYGGISTAHRILKAATATPIKIILVTPNTDMFWNMAASRAVLPGQFSDEQIFQPIAEGFKQYGKGKFEFVLGTAKSLDVEGKKVLVLTQGGERSLGFDYLVLATGSRTRGDTPLKGLGSTEETKRVLHEFQGRIERAKTIVVAGGGVTGVEVAGELGGEYGLQKKIILVTAATLRSSSILY